MLQRTLLRLCVSLLLAGLAAACDSAGEGSAHRAAARAGTRPLAAAPAARLPATMVRAVNSSGGEPPVDVRFDVEERPQVGKPVDIALALIPTAGLERLQAKFQASDGLELIKGAETALIVRPVVDTPITHTVTVVPQRDGIFTVMAVVLTDSESESVSRNFTIPLIAGTGLPESPGAASRTVADANPAQNPADR